MLAFAEMLVGVASDAGMKVPADVLNFDPEDYPHFYVFSLMQLGQPMPYPNVVFDNAEVIVEISEEEIKELTYEQILEKGFQIGFPTP